MSQRFETAFEGLSLRPAAGYTELSGTLAGHCQLQSLLNRFFGLGLQIVSVRAGSSCAEPDVSRGLGGDP